MKMFSKIFSLFMLMFAFGALAGCSGDTASTNSNPNLFNPKGTVSGLLRDAVTNEVLVDAKVSIIDKSATTNSSGLFVISDVPALRGSGNETTNGNPNYPVVIDMTNVNRRIADYNAVTTNTVKKAYYPSMAYTTVDVLYASLGETSQAVGNTNATNHDTPVDGFVANITPFVGKLDANIKMQVVDTDMAVVAGASVYLYQADGNSVGQNNDSTGAAQDSVHANPGHLVQGPLTSDATGFVTFANVEAKQQFVVKATYTDGREGWYTAAPLPHSVLANEQLVAVAITAPADGLTDTYAVQGGESFASTAGSAFNTALVITTNDNVAPFILSVSPSNLADIAVPTSGTQDIVFTFSEPIKSTNYSNAVSRELAENGANRGLYNDVTVSYLGPKAGNIPHTIAWNTDRTTLTVSIPYDSLTAASRYTVSIANALDASGTGDLLTDNKVNPFHVLTNQETLFTTSGTYNVAAPVIAKTNTSSVGIEWAAVSNAASYKVYVRTNATAYAADGTAADATTVFAVAGYPVFNMNTVPGFSLANGVVYTVKVVAVNGAGSESVFSNELSFSETAPSAPTGVARRSALTNVTETNIDWTPMANVQGYNVYIERVVAGIGQGYAKTAASPYTTATANVAADMTAGVGGSVYAEGQLKVTYNVKVTAIGIYDSESVASSVVSLDDKTRPTAAKGVAATTGVVPSVGYAAGTAAVRGAGTITVVFSKPMVESEVLAAASWSWNFLTATTATVTSTFGTNVSVATPITWTPATNTAVVPWSITTDVTGVVPAGAHTVSCTATSVGGTLAVTGGF